MTGRIAILDLGTNTFHLLLAEEREGQWVVFHKERQAVKLGKGGINRGLIQDDALKRAVASLQLFKTTIDREGISQVFAFGTSALRSAENGTAVLAEIRRQTGINVRVITGDEEAEYIYYGVRSALNMDSSPALIVDIGGGSVEFIIGDGDKIHWKVSLDIGAQRMLEQFHRHDPILPEEVNALQQHYHHALLSLHEAINRHQPRILAGSSGTFDTLSEIFCHQHQLPYHEGLPETPLTVQAFYEIHRQLVSRNREARIMIPGMIEMRVDMIVVASCLIEYLLKHFAFSSIRVSTYSLKEGILAAIAAGRLK